MIKELVDLAIEKQDENISKAIDDGYAREMSDAIFSDCFQKIHINIGRRTGKTSYIVENAKENDFILCHRQILGFMERFKKNNLPHIVVATKIDPLRFREIMIDHKKRIYPNEMGILYIDEPKFVFSGLNEETYHDILNILKPKRIIMLGD